MLIAPIVRTTPEIANHSFVLPIRSYFFQRSPVPIDPSTRGELMKLNPLRRPSIARVATTAVKIDVATPIKSIRAKPFTRRCRGRVQDARGDQRDDVGVDDRVESAPVPRRDRGADRFTRPHLLLDALEDDDVGVGGDADRQDRACDARKGHRHGQGRHDPGEEQAVDDERDVGDHAEEPVEDDQEDHHEDEAGGARDQAVAQRGLAERRRDELLRERRELDGQRPRRDLERDPRGVARADAGDLAAAAQRCVDAVRELGEAHRWRSDQLAVDDDGVQQVALGSRAGLRDLAGDVGEVLVAAVLVRERDDRLALRVDVGLGARDLVTGDDLRVLGWKPEEVPDGPAGGGVGAAGAGVTAHGLGAGRHRKPDRAGGLRLQVDVPQHLVCSGSIRETIPLAFTRLCGAAAENSAHPAGLPVGICFLAAFSML